ncbi:MAG: 50S ribosomal protein L4 [Deltaproteobacteria bacterium]|nr:MAG: 50S ribosomal protein L4 [Deltaproteobacteria bacterium]
MAVVDVLNTKGKKVSQRDLPDELFNVPAKPSVLHEVVTMQLAQKRSGTAAVKHRSDVNASRRKLFRQKGTGRARRGDSKSPLLRGGGVVFGPDPRSYAYKVPKKVRKLALKMALSTKFQEKNLLILDQFELERIKTKEFIKIIDALKVKNALIVTEKKNESLELASRNVPFVKVLRSEGLNVYDILKYENLILLESSINGIEGRLQA